MARRTAYGKPWLIPVAALGPSELVLADSSEFNLYSIDLEIGEARPNAARRARLADVRDRVAMAAIFAECRPELAFHAAALKHVPIIEAHTAEAVRTNIDGSRIVADLCRETGAATMVLISTDKAVNPTSAMRAGKPTATLLHARWDAYLGLQTSPSAVYAFAESKKAS